MDNTKKKLIASVVLNSLNLLCVTGCVIYFTVFNGIGDTVGGATAFRYFTTDSNILCAIASAVLLVFQIRGVKTGRVEIPKYAVVLKFVGTVAVTVTFLTVVFFLGPVSGTFAKNSGGSFFRTYLMFFEKSSLFLHLLCPLFAIVSFCFLENDFNFSIKESLWGILPTIVYGILYFVMVMAIGKANGGWEDFYNFNLGGMWYISIILMPLATFGISVIERLLHNKHAQE